MDSNEIATDRGYFTADSFIIGSEERIFTCTMTASEFGEHDSGDVETQDLSNTR